MRNRSARAGRLGWLAALLLGIASPAPGIDWTVDITGDENDAACAPGDCSLREAIAAAGDGDTILFALPGSPPWTIALNSALGQIQIDDDLTVVGPGAGSLTISGGDARRIFTVSASASVHLSGVRLFDGRAHLSADPHGGCLLVLGQATVADSRFESCEAWDGVITSNAVGGDGGAVHVAAGATFLADGVVFSANQAGNGGGNTSGGSGFTGGRGGAITNLGTATLIDCVVDGSRSGDGGGPAGFGGGGGGVANLGTGLLRVDSSTISSNRTGDGHVQSPVQGLDGRGGGLLCASTCILNNVTISGNAIGVVAGVGAANVGGGLVVAAGTTRLRNVTVASNTASGNGGGIARDGAGTIQTRNSIFANNDGAGINDECWTAAAAGVVSEGYNLIRVNSGCGASFGGTDQEGTGASPIDPLLGALADNGGPTLTRALGAGSPAIDGGDPLGCLAWNGVADVAMPFDQRGSGFPRATDGDGDATATCDAGAFEAPALPPPENDLTVAIAGAANGGTVTSDPVGIACPGDCSESYLATETVELFATPGADRAFVGWSGHCGGVGACEVTMNVDRNVTATFAELFDLAVTLSGGGGGTVESVPAGIDCPGVCALSYVDGAPVALSAAADPGSYFEGWSGSCSGSGACNLSMTADRAVTATFEALVPLDVALAGSGAGTVESSPAGIDCPGSCTAGYEIGEQVTLTATPDVGSTFDAWSGDCSGASCVVTLNVPRAVTATFVSLAVFADGFESGDSCLWSAVVGAPPCGP